jgi:hypothetical protein|tara:strand:+ start:472 stop:729 length:258 start_codon:yes stop_codon:yes gene_type:complete
MSKMRQFKFWNENGDEKEVEKMSLKKAIIAVQGDFKESVIGVEYISKRGKQISDSVKIPVGRKIRQAIIIERQKAAIKAAKGLSK